MPNNTPIGSFTISVLPANSLNVTDSWKRHSATVTIQEAEEAKFLFYLPTPKTGDWTETCTVTVFTDDGNIVKTLSPGGSTPNCESNNNLDAATFDNLASGEYDVNFSGSSNSGFYDVTYTFELEDGFDCRIVNVSSL